MSEHPDVTMDRLRTQYRALLAENDRLCAALEKFISFSVAGNPKYERFSDLARDYCALRREARQVLDAKGDIV